MTDIKKTSDALNVSLNSKIIAGNALSAPKDSKPNSQKAIDTISKNRVLPGLNIAIKPGQEHSMNPANLTSPKPTVRSYGSNFQNIGDFSQNDFIDKTKLSDSIDRETSQGKPFFLVQVTAKTQTGEIFHVVTSAANFYYRSESFDSAFKKENLTWVASDVIMISSRSKKPVKVCDFSAIYLDEYDISHEQESIFLINAISVPKEQEIKKIAATGYIAVMLDRGYILPRDKQAAKELISVMPSEERSLSLSFALEHLAEHGDRENFARWIAMGANIRTAISYGYDPILYSMTAKNWEIIDVIMEENLDFLTKEELNSYAKIAREEGNPSAAAGFLNILSKP